MVTRWYDVATRASHVSAGVKTHPNGVDGPPHLIRFS